MRILLFDDIRGNREEVTAALKAALGARGEIQEFVPGKEAAGTHEDRLAKDLLQSPNTPVDLIIADRDLSGYTNEYRGLSESTVRRVADALGIPECGYARGERRDDPDYISRGEHREACIRLDLKPLDRFAARAVAIADGFSMITKYLQESKAAGQKTTAAKLLAQILGKPQYADKIALYASGDQSRLMAVHRLRTVKEDEPQKIRRMTCLLGYWLWDSVLRFPGVTVGVIPASSYLNIQLEAFCDDPQIQELFQTAVYQGPFSGAKIKMWWRGMLDDIVSQADCKDGREFATKKLKRDIPPSQCCDESAIPAGYYCMLKQKPVSLKNSKGNLPWLPRGADLARVSNSSYEELVPWL